MKSFKDHLLDEDLRKWFGKGKEGDWVRVGTDGEIKGECAREKGEGKPKCMPRSRAHGMDKDDRAKAARRKRREDPVADRKGKGGKPVMVATEENSLEERKRGLWDNIRAKRARGGKPAKKGSNAYPDELEKIRMAEEDLHEKNVPTKPALWAKYKAQAKAKFDVYPSAYANGWASKMYKKAGGGWKTVSESSEVDEACWSGYKQVGMKKKGKKVVPDCVPEELVSVQPMDGPTGSMFAMKKEGKEHSWKSEGHYTKDGKEWTGPQHAHNGQVMTGEKHTADSQNLYHYKELSKEAQDKVEKKHEKIDEGIVDTVLKSKTLNRKNYSLAATELKKRMDADKNKKKETHAYDVARMHRNVDHRKLSTMVAGDWIQGDPILEKLDPSMGIKKYIGDFSKSDAPQFKGASSAKRRRMAVAAYLGAKRKKNEKALGEGIKYDSNMGAMDWGTPEGTEYMKDVTPGEESKKKKKVKEETEAHATKADYRKDNAEEAPELGDYALTKQDIKELELEADAITWEQAIELGMYDPNELEDDLNSADPHDEVNITEVLSVQGRLKRKFAARKNKQKLRVARNIALRRGSSPDRLKKRATRGARGMVYKRLLKGRDRSSLPPAEKGRLEKLIGMYAPLVSRLAVRMLPGMRKMEINRMKNRKGGSAQKSKKYKAATPVRKTSQKAKKFKVKR